VFLDGIAKYYNVNEDTIKNMKEKALKRRKEEEQKRKENLLLEQEQVVVLANSLTKSGIPRSSMISQQVLDSLDQKNEFSEIELQELKGRMCPKEILSLQNAGMFSLFWCYCCF
jgi:hypothetical protein